MLNNSLYQTIMRDYDRRQAEQKHLQDLRIQEIYEKIPEYQTLEQTIVSLRRRSPGPCFKSGPQSF